MAERSVSDGADHGRLVLQELREGFARQKALAEKALAQLEPLQWHARLDSGSNSVAVLVRHMAGNLRSRYTDFLTTDGEKPDRDRDGEFTATSLSPAEMLREWDEGWSALLGATSALKPEDLTSEVTIRGASRSVLSALLATFEHNSQHVGQIVMLGKHLRAGDWEYLSIPPKR